MILTALSRYYQRLASSPDPHSGEAKVPPFGYSEEKIAYVLVLSREGKLMDVVPNLTSDKKPKPKLLSVPRPEKRTSGVKANFLWDKTAYVLGIESNKDKKSAKETPWLVVEKTFSAFRELHMEALQGTEDVGLRALYLFLQQWQPENFHQAPCSIEMIDTNVVFRLDGVCEYLHQSAAAQALWTQYLVPTQNTTMVHCLVDGNTAPVARLHPAIKGVYGGQSSGGSIVSFNQDAFTSYGKEQGENAPISEVAAFTYTTALNYLLRRENGQCVSIGDASTVFWAETDDDKQARAVEGFFGLMTNSVDEAGELQKLQATLEKMAKGRPLAEFAPGLDANTRFYVLGLAPNASRLSIRYWLDTTFGELAKNFAQHWQDLYLEPVPWREPPSIWRLLIQTAVLGKTENIPPQLAGELMRAILTGSRYPLSVLSQLIGRIRADGDVNGLRVAMIKAILCRELRQKQSMEVIPVSLDKHSTHVAYLLGRLFAVLERIQLQALGEVNAGIADRYYGSASAVPYSVFPRLLAGAKHHLSKLRKEKPGYAILLDKDLGEIVAILSQQAQTFPKHLNIEAQGRFAIGYYQQKQSYFAKKESTETSENQGAQS